MADDARHGKSTTDGQLPACRLSVALDRITALRRQLPVARASAGTVHAIAALGSAAHSASAEAGTKELDGDLLAENAHLRARLTLAEARVGELESVVSASPAPAPGGESSDAAAEWEWVAEAETWAESLGDELGRQGRRAATEALLAASQIDRLAALSGGLGLAIRPGPGGLLAAASSRVVSANDLASLSQAWSHLATLRGLSDATSAGAASPNPRSGASPSLAGAESKVQRDVAALAQEVATLVGVLASTKRELENVRALRVGQEEGTCVTLE